MTGRAVTGERLRVDPVACDGVGICAHLAPELIRVDRWGYPVVSDEELDDRRARRARAAATACPRRALFLESLRPATS